MDVNKIIMESLQNVINESVTGNEVQGFEDSGSGKTLLHTAKNVLKDVTGIDKRNVGEKFIDAKEYIKNKASDVVDDVEATVSGVNPYIAAATAAGLAAAAGGLAAVKKMRKAAKK